MFELVDELGKVNQAIKELEATARKLKSELIARGVGTYGGAQFVAEVQEYDRANIDATLVRQIADEDFISQVTKIQHVTAVVVKSV
jgi:PHP family Zn ribbon phosphoesterase